MADDGARNYHHGNLREALIEAGLKLLIIDLSVTFTQVADGGGTVGTLTQFLLGTTFDIPAGSLRFENGQPRSIVRPAIQGGGISISHRRLNTTESGSILPGSSSTSRTTRARASRAIKRPTPSASAP